MDSAVEVQRIAQAQALIADLKKMTMPQTSRAAERLSEPPSLMRPAIDGLVVRSSDALPHIRFSAEPNELDDTLRAVVEKSDMELDLTAPTGDASGQTVEDSIRGAADALRLSNARLTGLEVQVSGQGRTFTMQIIENPQRTSGEMREIPRGDRAVLEVPDEGQRDRHIGQLLAVAQLGNHTPARHERMRVRLLVDARSITPQQMKEKLGGMKGQGAGFLGASLEAGPRDLLNGQAVTAYSVDFGIPLKPKVVTPAAPAPQPA